MLVKEYWSMEMVLLTIFTAPQRVKELAKGQNGYAFEFSCTWLKADAQVALEFLFLSNGTQGFNITA